MRRREVFFFVLAALALASEGGAQPADKEACAKAFEKAQVDRKAHRLIAAQKELAFCAQKSCPAIARHDCATWLAEVDAALPTIVFEIRQEGKLVRDVRVSVDGSIVLEKVEDGVPLPIDPGAHALKFERTGSRVSAQELIVVHGAKNRLVSVTLEPDLPLSTAPAPAPTTSAPRSADPEPDRGKTPNPPASTSTPVLAWVFAGVAVIGLGSFAGFGLRGVSEENKLRETCAPSCSQESIDFVDRMYLVADISLGVAIVAAGISATLFITRLGTAK